MRYCLSTVATVMALSLALAEDDKKPEWYKESVKTVEASFEPKNASPGETVTLKLTVELKPGYKTYPMKQPDPNVFGMVNSVKLPEDAPLEFVGTFTDPKGFKSNPEPELGIKELRIYVKKVTYSQKAKVKAGAELGTITVTIPKFTLSVCSGDTCFPPIELKPTAKLDIVEKK